MQTPTWPGVYIQEVSSGVHTITGVSTSLTAFIGTAVRGPVNQLTRIQKFGEYVTQFGGVDPLSEMSYAIMQFFLNGGSDSWVVRVAANAKTATLSLLDGSNNPSLDFTAIDGGTAGNGTAVAIDAADPNRFTVTLTSAPDANGNIRTEQYIGVSMNSTDTQFVEAIINGTSNLVTVKRDPGAGFGRGTSVNNPPAAISIDATHNTIRVLVDGGSPIAVIFAAGDDANAIAGKITTALTPSATTAVTATNEITITRAAPASDHSSVVVLPGLQNDAARILGFGTANGGVETDGSAVARPKPSPDPGTWVVSLNEPAGHANGSIALTLDNGRPVIIGLQVSDLAAPNYGTTFAARLQAAVRSFRPTVIAYARFTASFAAGQLTMSSGTRGAGSAVSVANAPADTLAADFGLTAGTATAGGSQVLAGGSEDPLSSSNIYPTFVPPPSAKAGIYALENADIFNILCLPGITDGTTLQDAAAYCEERRAFLIVDPPSNQKPTDIEALVTGTTLPKSDHAAIYYPNLRITDPVTNTLRVTAPSGTVAGVYARIDGNRGVWKAPAGTETNLTGVQALEYVMTDGENGIINPVGANAIRQFRTYGIVSWGARTLMGADAIGSQYKYVPVRRLALYIEQSLYEGTQWVVFEPNDEPLWAQIRLNVGSFMNTLFRQGAFQGASPRDAYFVKCDSETTQQADIDRGIVNIIVGFAPLKPAEFVMIQIAQIAGQLAT